MRQEEVCGLEWSQVSIQRREVRLTKTKTSIPRIVPFSDEALRTIIGTPQHVTGPTCSGTMTASGIQPSPISSL
jgi:integrase